MRKLIKVLKNTRKGILIDFYNKKKITTNLFLGRFNHKLFIIFQFISKEYIELGILI